MIRALLAGTKTQTRRIVKLPHQNPLGQWEPTTFGGPNGGRTRRGETIPEQPGIWHTRTGEGFGARWLAGDRLWVRETHAIVPRTAYARSDGVHQTLRPNDDHEAAIYRADWERSTGGIRWLPSIHMPRWASRITLELLRVRVERLQAISSRDAIAEGIEACPRGGEWRDYLNPSRDTLTPRNCYRTLWESINGPGSWDANPWVWAIDFRRLT